MQALFPHRSRHDEMTLPGWSVVTMAASVSGANSGSTASCEAPGSTAGASQHSSDESLVDAAHLIKQSNDFLNGHWG